MEKISGVGRLSPEADFQRALLLEASGNKTAAKQKYQTLVRSGFADASFRLGMIAQEKQLYPEARKHFQNLLNEYPGDSVALWYRAQSESMLKLPKTALKTLEVLVKQVPYDERVAQMLLKMHAALNSVARGDRWLKENRERYTPLLTEWWTLWKLSASEKWDLVLKTISDEYKETHSEDTSFFRLQALHGLGRLTYTETVAVSKQFPDVLYITGLKGELMLDRDKGAAVKVLLRLLKQEPSPHVFHLLFKGCSVSETSDHLFGLLEKGRNNNEFASSAIQSMYTVLIELERYEDAKAFLLAVRSRFPDQLEARMELVRIHLSEGEMEDAQKEAEYIYGKSKEEPKAIWLYAQALDAESPRRAEALYKDYFERSKDASALTAIGSLKHREGASKAAASLYREALELDEMQPYALINLYALVGSSHHMFEPCCAILNGPSRPDLMNFCVIAVFIAIQQKEKLPAAWEAQAAERLKAMAEGNQEGGEEEIHTLSLMLLIWAKSRQNRSILLDIISDETYWKNVDRYAQAHISWRDRCWVQRGSR